MSEKLLDVRVDKSESRISDENETPSCLRIIRISLSKSRETIIFSQDSRNASRERNSTSHARD